MLSCNNNSLSAVFKHDSLFIDLVQRVMTYTVMYEMEYNVQFPQARVLGIEMDL